MSCVIQVVGFAREGEHCDFEGQYLEWYDPNIPDPSATMATFTNDLAKAKRFATAAAAMIEWHRVREVDPVRPDGRPNKPLTAFTIDIHGVPDDVEPDTSDIPEVGEAWFAKATLRNPG